eukprot:7378794-Lingulodinium_polyedra.AAC.1
MVAHLLLNPVRAILLPLVNDPDCNASRLGGEGRRADAQAWRFQRRQDGSLAFELSYAYLHELHKAHGDLAWGEGVMLGRAKYQAVDWDALAVYQTTQVQWLWPLSRLCRKRCASSGILASVAEQEKALAALCASTSASDAGDEKAGDEAGEAGENGWAEDEDGTS